MPQHKGTMNWGALEMVRGLVAVPAEWRARLRAHHDTFSGAYLRTRKTTVTSIPCPQGCGCAHEVVRHGDESLVAICRCEPWNCDDVTLTEADVELWELNEEKLGRELAKALDIDTRTRPLDIPGVMQIGAFGRAALPVVLVIRGEQEELRGAVVELVARLKERFIVLTPTSRRWDFRVKELLASAKAGLFELESLMTLDPQGRLHAAKRGNELFEPYLPAAEEKAPEEIVSSALELVKRLDSDMGVKAPTLITVFRLYCGTALTAQQVADRCGCSKGTIINRLALLRKKTGVDPDKMRAYASHIEKTQEAMTDSRARSIRASAVLDDEDDDQKDDY
jgi:hypothetical protein